MAIGVSEQVEAGEAAAARSFLGWRMVGVGFIANSLSGAITLSAFGNFVDPVSVDFGVSRATIGYGVSISFLVMGLLGPFSGAWLDRGRARSMMVVGVLLAGAGLILLSRTTELWQAGLLFCGVIALGAALFGIMPSMALIAQWFEKRRGIAIGMAVAGATLASYPAPVLAEYLIGSEGWRTAVMVFGAGTLLLGLPVFWGFVISRPEEVGQRPDGEAHPDPEGPEPETDPGIPLRDTAELARDPRLWMLAIGFGLILTSPIVLTPLLVPFGKDLGFTGQQANVFFLAMIPFSLLGKIVIGGLADVAPIRPAMALVVLANMLMWFSFHAGPGYAAFVVTGAIYGLGIGGAMPLQGVAIGRCFGRANFGRASGLGGLVTIPLIAAASALSQVLLASTGNYQATFLVQMGLIGLGGVLLFLVRIPASEAEGAAVAVP